VFRRLRKKKEPSTSWRFLKGFQKGISCRYRKAIRTVDHEAAYVGCCRIISSFRDDLPHFLNADILLPSRMNEYVRVSFAKNLVTRGALTIGFPRPHT
jgi:hypothetical protein